MEQHNIYNYIGQQQDPLFQTLESLKCGQRASIDKCDIHLNKFGLYEVDDKENEYAFSDLKQCYKKILEIAEL